MNKYMKSLLLAFGVTASQVANSTCECGSASPAEFAKYGVGISQNNNAGVNFDYDPLSMRSNGVESLRVRNTSEVADNGFVKQNVEVVLNALDGAQIKLCADLAGTTTKNSEVELDYNRIVYSGDSNTNMAGPAVPGNRSVIEAVDTGDGKVETVTIVNGIRLGKQEFKQTDTMYKNPDYTYLPVHGEVAVDNSTKPGNSIVKNYPKHDFQ